MSYKEINASEIAAGEPTTNTVLTKVKDNLINHETRTTSLEGGSAVVYPPLEFRVNGYYHYQGAATGWVTDIAPFNLTITGVRLYIDRAGTAGDTEIDLMVKSGSGLYTSVFTTKPKCNFINGDDAIFAGILNQSMTNVLQGASMRLDTTSVQTLGHSFTVRIDYIKN